MEREALERVSTGWFFLGSPREGIASSCPSFLRDTQQQGTPSPEDSLGKTLLPPVPPFLRDTQQQQRTPSPFSDPPQQQGTPSPGDLLPVTRDPRLGRAALSPLKG